MTSSRKHSLLLICISALITNSAVLALAVIVICAGGCFDTNPRGVLSKEADWPEPVEEMHAAMSIAGVDLKSFSVCLLRGQPGQTLSTAVCRIDSSSAALNVLTAHLDLKPTTLDNAMRWAGSEVLRCASSDWWTGADDNNAEFYASNNLIVGGEGNEYVVAHDKLRNILFIHYHFNF